MWSLFKFSNKTDFPHYPGVSLVDIVQVNTTGQSLYQGAQEVSQYIKVYNSEDEWFYLSNIKGGTQKCWSYTLTKLLTSKQLLTKIQHVIILITHRWHLFFYCLPCFNKEKLLWEQYYKGKMINSNKNFINK